MSSSVRTRSVVRATKELPPSDPITLPPDDVNTRVEAIPSNDKVDSEIIVELPERSVHEVSDVGIAHTTNNIVNHRDQKTVSVKSKSSQTRSHGSNFISNTSRRSSRSYQESKPDSIATADWIKILDEREEKRRNFELEKLKVQADSERLKVQADSERLKVQV